MTLNTANSHITNPFQKLWIRYASTAIVLVIMIAIFLFSSQQQERILQAKMGDFFMEFRLQITSPDVPEHTFGLQAVDFLKDIQQEKRVFFRVYTCYGSIDCLITDSVGRAKLFSDFRIIFTLGRKY